MNQTNKAFGITFFIELTEGNAKKEDKDEKRFHRNGV